MKKILVFAILGILIVSCSKDEITTLQEELVGTWQLNQSVTDAPIDLGEYITFGTTICYESDASGKQIGTQQNYTLEYNHEKKVWVMTLGEKKLDVLMIGNALSLSYIKTPATETEPEKRVTYAYIKV